MRMGWYGIVPRDEYGCKLEPVEIDTDWHSRTVQGRYA